MAVTREDLERQARDLQRNLTSAQQHLGELLRAIAAMPAAGFTGEARSAPAVCGSCGSGGGRHVAGCGEASNDD